MGLPTSGKITLKDIAVELETPLVGFRLGSPASRELAGIPSGKITVKDFYGKASVIIRTIASNVNDLNLFTLAGSPTKAGKYRFDILAGVAIGQVSAIAALVAGAFPAGSDIIINNAGAIRAKGGVAPGGNGGDAIKLDVEGVTVTINNTGDILSGGGAGGTGGFGGQGGRGGDGTVSGIAWYYGALNYSGQPLLGYSGSSYQTYGDNYWVYGTFRDEETWTDVVKWNGQFYSSDGYGGYPPIPHGLIKGTLKAWTTSSGSSGDFNYYEIGHISNAEWRYNNDPHPSYQGAYTYLDVWSIWEGSYIYLNWNSEFVASNETSYAGSGTPWYGPGYDITYITDYYNPNIVYCRGQSALYNYYGLEHYFWIGKGSSSLSYTTGGAGGAGGAGGTGGRGQGCDGSSAMGTAGGYGQAGALGGTNAGMGGAGGQGGAGGTGGSWGSDATSGALGSKGGIGANGNYTAGLAGADGQAGTPGGKAGKSIIKGLSTVTINNSGTILGPIV